VTGIHCLAVPTPFRVGRVNCYLVDDDPLTLIDVGPASAMSMVALEAALAQHGRTPEQLERIAITHQHADHLGLVGILAERSGAEVCALDVLQAVVEDFNGYAERNDRFAQQVMRRHGIAEDIINVLGAMARGYRGWGGSAPVTQTLTDASTLDFAHRSFEVLHRPGHSPTDTIFFDADDGTLIAGDHLIGHISSNPLIALPPTGEGHERPKTLMIYLDSLEATRQMPVTMVLPGHGISFDDHARLIAERFQMHERRAAKLHGLISEQPRTAHELARALWGDVAVTQALLTLSEVLGHVDLLCARGEVVEHEHEGVVRFYAA
jgi:glyoxylase-like metal-dependent hydrolase (beta-lactamase superfamily II)